MSLCRGGALAGFMTGSRPASLDDQARLDAGRPGLLLPSETALLPRPRILARLAVRLAYSRIETSLTYAVNLSGPSDLADVDQLGGRTV
jgi:hypothetical protein